MATPFPFVASQVLTAAQLNSITELPIMAKTTSYTLVAGDAGDRIQMTSASATTITVNASVFSAGQMVFIYNMGAGVCTITAGTATVTTSGSLALAQYGGGTLLFTSSSAATFFPNGGIGYGTATGGIGAPTSVTISGVNYQYLQFNSTGTLTITKAGLFDCMVWSAGGGGAGGIGTSGYTGGGGAGAGGYMQQTLYLDTNQTVTIGAGGAGGGNEAYGSRGNTSSIGTLIAIIGGSAGQGYNTATNNSQCFGPCGSGGAGHANTSLQSILPYAASFGFAGGTGVGGFTGGAGGGGGVTAAGANGATTNGGAGGAGYDVSAFIGGSALRKGGGGGGAGPGTGGAGGSSVGGAGASGANNAGGAASANTASGGGSATGTSTGGAGGSGLVYIRWKV